MQNGALCNVRGSGLRARNSFHESIALNEHCLILWPVDTMDLIFQNKQLGDLGYSSGSIRRRNKRKAIDKIFSDLP